nr:nucleoside triphosphate pyrophosphohydrolase [Halogranum amylolyticum]
MEFDKLVRDRIPDLVRESGDRPETHVADDSEYRRRLREKLVEEATEFRESGDAEELADVLTVVGTLCRVEGIDREEVERLGREKTQERGGFEERIVLERVRK